MTPWPRWWLAALIAFGFGCLAFVVVPEQSWASSVVYQAVALAAIALLVVSIRQIPREGRAVWYAVLAYALISDVGDIIYDLQAFLGSEPPYPGPADIFYLAGYGAALLALGLLIRRTRGSGDLEAWIDTAIIAVGTASVVGVLVIEPIITEGDESNLSLSLSLAYPLLDLILLAGLGRLLVGRGRTNPAIALVSAAFLATFLADLMFSYLSSTGLDGVVPAGLDVLYLAAFSLLALAASAPGARVLVPPDHGSASPSSPLDARPTAPTVVALAIGALTVPFMLVYTTWSGTGTDIVLLSLACVLVVALVLWRFRLLLRVAGAQAQDLARLARTDGLTGLPNRRTLDFELERQEALAREQESQLCVAMLDLDRFKAYNDTYGHQAGDEALVAAAQAWRTALGLPGFLARYGGEEFAAVLPGADLERAQRLLESARRATPAGLSVSVGVAQWHPDESAVETLLRADRALYRAKDLGRDRIVASEDETWSR